VLVDPCVVVVVVVVGASLVVDDGVGVSDEFDGAALVTGPWVSVVPGSTGAVLTPEVGAFGVLPDV
jgi:hypothetical protein